MWIADCEDRGKKTEKIELGSKNTEVGSVRQRAAGMAHRAITEKPYSPFRLRAEASIHLTNTLMIPNQRLPAERGPGPF